MTLIYNTISFVTSIQENFQTYIPKQSLLGTSINLRKKVKALYGRAKTSEN